jgi:hypothetical protein
MSTSRLAEGTVHKLPADLKKALTAVPKAQMAWNDLTPLARNEWICWTITCKQAETRHKHVKRVIAELQQGKRRPCCWIGCIHRTDKAISPSIQWVLSRQSKTK